MMVAKIQMQRVVKTYGIIFGLGILLVFFQNCSDVEFAEKQTTFTECADPNFADCTISPSGQSFRQVYKIGGQRKRQADILFIIDTSGSMDYEQVHIQKRFATFIDTLADVDWRVGITTARMDSDMLEFVGAPGGAKILDPTMAESHTYFANTIRRPKSCGLKKNVDDCDDHERAILQANRLISTNAQNGFFRPGADANIIIVSDEDEKSDGKKLSPEDLPETLIANAKTELNVRSFSVHAIITRPGDKACLKGEGARYGEVYERVAQLTKGVVGNVCADDYTEQLHLIANDIRMDAQVIDLPCLTQGPPMISSIPVLDPTYEVLIKEKTMTFNKPLYGDYDVIVEGVCQPVQAASLNQNSKN